MVLKDIQRVNKEASKRYDAAVSLLKGVDKKLAKAPDDSDLLKSREQLKEVVAGLKATVDFCNSLAEQHNGGPITEPERHDTRGHKGQFARKGSIGHMMRGAGLLIKKIIRRA
jgi:hypothetical protein